MSVLIDKKTWLLIASKAGWSLPKPKIVKASSLSIDLQSEPVAIPSNTRRSINTALSNLGSYHTFVPLTEINAILEKNNCIMLQEDGTKWEGFVMPEGYCGETNGDGSPKNQPMKFDLAMRSQGGAYKRLNNILVMSACKMPSGKVEVITYIS